MRIGADVWVYFVCGGIRKSKGKRHKLQNAVISTIGGKEICGLNMLILSFKFKFKSIIKIQIYRLLFSENKLKNVVLYFLHVSKLKG